MRNQPSVFGRILFALPLVLICWLSSTCCADDEHRLQQQFETVVKPILKSMCGECHWGVEANAGLNFEVFKTLDHVLDADRRWSAVVDQIRNKTMPPDDSRPLDDFLAMGAQLFIARQENMSRAIVARLR